MVLICDRCGCVVSTAKWRRHRSKRCVGKIRDKAMSKPLGFTIHMETEPVGTIDVYPSILASLPQSYQVNLNKEGSE